MEYSAYVGLDVHKDTIAVAVAVAPSLIPRKLGDRVKTDRRDALTLARLHRSGDLTAVWVPGPEQEAMRDLTRAREDMKAMEQKERQRLGAFLLRHGRVYCTGRSRWTQAHFRWLEAQAFESPVQQVVFQEYIDAVTQAQALAAGKADPSGLKWSEPHRLDNDMAGFSPLAEHVVPQNPPD